ncbi:hypothetical protein [Halobacterium zhouii]|uniref:hypothetical protein n=1 Tax=Halobacterium zhouii TaxID=2902624 RepID=UPI001E6563C1|nr:hypothetical protein [Halobacterium zhouii]
MKRRTFLSAAGVTFSTALSGCLGERSGPRAPGGGNGTPTEEPTTQEPTRSGTDPPDEPDVEVEDIVVRKAVRYSSIMGSGGVLAADDQQYVVASVQSDQELSESAFTLETDGQSWEPGLPETAGAINSAVAGHEGSPVGRNLGVSDRSYLAFAVPSPLTTSEASIRFGESASEWPLPDAEQSRLAAPAPRFELDSLDVPEQVSQGEPLSVSLTATNVSETDGRFLAAVYWPTKRIADDDESHVVEREVASGDQVTASLEIDTEYTTSEDEPVTLSVRGHVTGERTIRIRDSRTSS